MPRVNLIMERRKRERRDSLLMRILIYGCTLSAGSFAVTFAVTEAQSISKATEITGAERGLESIKPKIAEVKKMQTEEQELTPRLQLLQEAKESTTHWYLVYQQLGQGLPTTSWLDSVNLGGDTKTGAMSLVLGGESLNEDSVAATIQQLQKQPLFDKVELHVVQQPPPAAPPAPGTTGPVPPQTLQPVRFEIGVQLKQPQGPTNAKPNA